MKKKQPRLTTTTGARRLLRLARRLQTVPPDRFSMRAWLYAGPLFEARLPPIGECGTTACAVGWACAMPEFQRAGLRLIRLNKYEAWEPRFGRHRNWDAVKRFFRLSDEDAEHLFSYRFTDSGQIKGETPKLVALRIRRFVAQRGHD